MPPPFVDIHCHCLPNVDDGPRGTAEAVGLCRLLVADGVRTVIATPHQLGRYERRNEGPAVLAAVAQLRASLLAAGVPLAVEAGGDVRIDERVARMVRDGRVLGLGPTGRYVLLELPPDTFIDPRLLIDELAAAGRCVVISHPERYAALLRKPDRLADMIAAGAVAQVTAGSLLGDFGDVAKDAAWYWLARGQAHVVASDAHDTRQRPPRMSAAHEKLDDRFGPDVAALLTCDNPGRILRGEDVLPPPAEVRGALAQTTPSHARHDAGIGSPALSNG